MHPQVYAACRAELTKIASRAWMRQLQSGAISPKDITDAAMRASARMDFPQGLVQAPHLERAVSQVANDIVPLARVNPTPSVTHHVSNSVNHVKDMLGFNPRRADPLATRRSGASPTVRSFEIIQDARRRDPAINTVARATERRARHSAAENMAIIEDQHRQRLDSAQRAYQDLQADSSALHHRQRDLNDELSAERRLRQRDAGRYEDQLKEMRDNHEVAQIRMRQEHRNALEDQEQAFTTQLGATADRADAADRRATRNAYLGVGAGIGAGVGGLALGAGGMALANADNQPQPQPPPPTPRPSY